MYIATIWSFKLSPNFLFLLDLFLTSKNSSLFCGNAIPAIATFDYTPPHQLFNLTPRVCVSQIHIHKESPL